MKRKKPDALLLLAVIFGLGLIVSTVTHGGGEADRAERMAAQSATAHASLQTRSSLNQ